MLSGDFHAFDDPDVVFFALTERCLALRLTSPHRDYTASHALPFMRARMPVTPPLEPVALTRYRTSYSAIRFRNVRRNSPVAFMVASSNDCPT